METKAVTTSLTLATGETRYDSLTCMATLQANYSLYCFILAVGEILKTKQRDLGTALMTQAQR